jgi:hypothetical protein
LKQRSPVPHQQNSAAKPVLAGEALTVIAQAARQAAITERAYHLSWCEHEAHACGKRRSFRNQHYWLLARARDFM